MRNSFAHGVGGVLSADIAVPDHEQELAFYSSVLTTGEKPLWREDLMNNQGTPVIGLGARTSEYSELPLQWMPHFQVADVAASAASAVELGGKELMRDGKDQWAVLTDHDGAAFGIIPVVDAAERQTGKDERFGNISWLTLATADTTTSQAFYQKVVGWDAKAIEAADDEGGFVNFDMQRDDGMAAAEICGNRGDLCDIPAVWLMSLPVGDLSESRRRVAAMGGEVVRVNSDENWAIIRDPVGVYFALQNGLNRQGLV